jgi:hypothetical protein
LNFSKDKPAFHSMQKPWPLWAVSVLVFGLGALVYVWDRGVGTTLLLPSAFGHRSGEGLLFGALGGSLPSFAHAFAFTLLTAALLGRNARARWLAGGGWWLVDTLFELGQHPALKDQLATFMPGVIGAYFMHGTFDYFDLLATTLGVLAAGWFHFSFIREQPS